MEWCPTDVAVFVSCGFHYYHYIFVGGEIYWEGLVAADESAGGLASEDEVLNDVNVDWHDIAFVLTQKD